MSRTPIAMLFILVAALAAFSPKWATGRDNIKDVCPDPPPTESKPWPRLFGYCPGSYTNECYDRWNAARREVDEHNRLVRICKAKTDPLGRAGQAPKSAVVPKRSNNSQSWDERQRAAEERNASKRGTRKAEERKLERLLNEHIQKQERDRSASNKQFLEKQEQIRLESERLARENTANRIRMQHQIDNDNLRNSSTGRLADTYPPGCRNKRSFDACAIDGKGCSLGSRAGCLNICRSLCDD
jgi:hypothetical protein